MITLPSHRSALLFLFCRFRSAQRLRLTSSASACSSAVQQKPPSVSRAGVSVILPIQRSWLLHMDRRAGGVNPALPDFLGLFRLPHDPLLATHAANASMNFMRNSRVASFVIFPLALNSCAAPPMYASGCCIVGTSKNTRDCLR
jgi:hypothetical protein